VDADISRADVEAQAAAHIVGVCMSPRNRLCRRRDALRELLRSVEADRLIERFGADAASPDVLMALVSCQRRADFSKLCGDLAGFGAAR